jgi:competence protein ComEA
MAAEEARTERTGRTERTERTEREEIVRRRIFAATGVAAPDPDRVHAERREFVPAALLDRLPLAVQSRFPLTWAHAVPLVLLVSAALLVSAWWIARSGPQGELIPTAAGSEPSPLVATPTLVAEVVVHVAGRVRSPGLYRLPEGARVFDALEAAGGARPRVDLSTVNLARVLLDGEQILVGTTPQPGAPGGSSSGSSLVNLNSADQALLETLPGVGPVTASAIMEFREQNGPFASVDDLLDVSGIGEKTLEQLRPFVTV